MYILLAENVCNESTVLRVILMIKNILNVIKIIVPILLILLGMLDIFKAVIKSNEKEMAEYKNKFIRRIIASVFIFLIPVLIDFCFDTFDNINLEYAQCWTAATKENVSRFSSEEKALKQKQKEVKKQIVEEKRKKDEADRKKRFESITPLPSRPNTGISSGAISNSRTKLVNAANGYVGVLKYVWGGTSLTTGADCSGFVMSLYKSVLGKDIPRTAAQQYAGCKPINENELRIGDLVFYKRKNDIHHVGMYIGNNQIVHSQCTKCGPVKISEMNYSKDTRLYGNCMGD